MYAHIYDKYKVPVTNHSIRSSGHIFMDKLRIQI